MSYKHLTIEERNIIYRMQWQGYKNSKIACCLGRHRSTISRECKRNLNCQNSYDPGNAQTMANVRRKAHLHRPKTENRLLMAFVSEYLQKRWSPEQIAGRLSAFAPTALSSLTLDNGREFARPVELEKRLKLKVFFAHPYHAWERGTNENTNGLLRQYLPKGFDFSILTNEQLRSYVNALNHRPRKCLGYKTPFEVFHKK